MNAFSHVDDYDYALSLAKKSFPDLNESLASRATSGWDELEVQIKDKYGNTLCAFPSSQFVEYLRNSRGPRDNNRSSLADQGVQPRRDSKIFAPSSTPAAASAARSMVRTIKDLSTFLSGFVVLVGAILAIILAYQGNALSILVFALFAVTAFVSHWIVKLTYVGLEVLADISEDLRAMRSRSDL